MRLDPDDDVDVAKLKRLETQRQRWDAALALFAILGIISVVAGFCLFVAMGDARWLLLCLPAVALLRS